MPEPATVTRPRARTSAPIHPRRVSGPARRPLPAGAAIPHRSRTGAFERISRIPDHRVVDRLLRGRACILLIGIMLGGIVAMQVSLLRLNSGISRAVQTQTTLERQNIALQAGITQLTSGERIRTAAADKSMVDPLAGDTRYLRARPATDPIRALRRMQPPSARAQEVMANGGMLPGALATTGTAGAQVAASLNNTVPSAVPTPAPTATVAPVATPAATAAVATATPPPAVATATPPVTTAPDTGAATTPQG